MRLRIVVLAAIATVVSMLGVAPAGAAVLGSPTGLTATAGNQQVALSWTAPPAGGNPAVSDYRVEYSSDNGITWSQFPHATSIATSITVTSLTNNVSYAFRVSAFNSDGVGTPSAAAVAIPVSNHSPNDAALFRACPTGVAPVAGFSDTTATAVDCVKYYGITRGTTATTYSPIDSVTRWQMALFLTRMATVSGLTLPSGTDQGFTDILGKSAEIQTAINQIKQLGITVGKTASTFAPDDNVTREEMALFISRFLTKATPGPGGNTEYVTGNSGAKEIKSNDADHNFTDLDQVYLWETQTSIINLWNLGVTDVQNWGTYDPRADMTRAAMATFIANALDHTNARPVGLVMQASTYRTSGTPAVTISVTYRTSDFSPIGSTPVDTFKFLQNVDASITSFDSSGNCTANVLVTVVDTSKCQVTNADRSTDVNGNIENISTSLSANVKTDFWAWTAAAGTLYDNDVHAAAASKITIETTP